MRMIHPRSTRARPGSAFDEIAEIAEIAEIWNSVSAAVDGGRPQREPNL
ncbi:hypothetical protein [Mycolicibacterium hodleri]|nr:hypothetical protein [Mycolicibacterium hodleri]